MHASLYACYDENICSVLLTCANQYSYSSIFSEGSEYFFFIVHKLTGMKNLTLPIFVFDQLFLDDATDPWGVRVERVEM